MSLFRSTRRQRRLAAALAPYRVTTFPSFTPTATSWPVVHADKCRCTYCA